MTSDEVLSTVDAPTRAAFEATNRGDSGAFVIATDGRQITRWDISG